LYGAELRPGEADRLQLQDVRLHESILIIKNTKFHKSRIVPIGKDLKEMLAAHWQEESYDLDARLDAPFFRTRRGGVLSSHANHQFQELRRQASVLRVDNTRYQPRLHDFRHTFAVNRLVAWYREGKDVQRLLPKLSTYLGHARISGTSIYLQMTTALLEEANKKFEAYAQRSISHA
jgi:integrase/recombinase XerD